MLVNFVILNSNMCEKRIRKIIKKGSDITRQREARRLHRIQNMTPSPAVNEDAHRPRLPKIMPVIDKTAQNKFILELALKTVMLMQRNKLIQQKIIDLQKETSEFVANIMNNPENRLRYISHMRSQANAEAVAQDMSVENKENNNIIFKTEPED